MSNVMFHWITKKLSVSRPHRVPGPTSGDRGQNEVGRYAVNFDRLHCECVTSLTDGSIITLQLLHGVLAGAATSIDGLSGVPPAAIRHLPSHLLPSLESGLTVLVYDIRSDVSVCVKVEGKHLPRYSEAFGTTEGDLPQLCRQMIAVAHGFVRLSRVGEVCTGMTFDMGNVPLLVAAMRAKDSEVALPVAPSEDNKKTNETSEIPKTIPMQATVVVSREVSMGRKQVVVGSRGSRLAAARALLAKFSQ